MQPATQKVDRLPAKSTPASRLLRKQQSKKNFSLRLKLKKRKKKRNKQLCHRSMCFLIELTRALFGTAPTTVMTLLRSLKSMRVGMFRIFNSATVVGFSSVHISNTFSFPPCSAMTSSTTGPTMRHGPHLNIICSIWIVS